MNIHGKHLTIDRSEKSHIVFRGVHFDQNASNYDKYSWKTFDN